MVPHNAEPDVADMIQEWEPENMVVNGENLHPSSLIG